MFCFVEDTIHPRFVGSDAITAMENGQVYMREKTKDGEETDKLKKDVGFTYYSIKPDIEKLSDKKNNNLKRIDQEE